MKLDDNGDNNKVYINITDNFYPFSKCYNEVIWDPNGKLF